MSYRDHTILSALKFIIGNYQDEEIQRRILERIDSDIELITHMNPVGWGQDGVPIVKDPIWDKD